MNRRFRFLVGFIALAFIGSAPQQQQTDTAQVKQDFKNALCQIRKDELKSCQQKVKEWSDWADETKPKNEALANENARLRAENFDLKHTDDQPGLAQLVVMGTGVGMGIGIIVFLVIFWRKLAPTTPRKQLAVLILCSVWIVVIGIICASDTFLNKHPINLLAAVFLYSLPAILFGGIALWWFKRTKPDVIKLW